VCNGVLGVPLDERGLYIGSSWDLVRPYQLLVGLFAVALFAVHGKILLSLKTEGAVQDRLGKWVWHTWGLFLVLYLLTTIYNAASSEKTPGIGLRSFNHVVFRLALLILVSSCPAFANDGQANTSEVEDSERSVELTRQILEEEADSRRRTIGLLRFRASYPLKVSAGFGWMRVRLPTNYDCRTICDLEGPTFQIEPGLAGVQLSVGYAHLIGEKKRSRHFLKGVYVGYGGKAVLLRTYGDSPLEPSGQTLVGAEGDVTVATVNLSFGILKNLSDDRERDWIGTVGLGWGF